MWNFFVFDLHCLKILKYRPHHSPVTNRCTFVPGRPRGLAASIPCFYDSTLILYHSCLIKPWCWWLHDFIVWAHAQWSDTFFSDGPRVTNGRYDHRPSDVANFIVCCDVMKCSRGFLKHLESLMGWSTEGLVLYWFYWSVYFNYWIHLSLSPW